MAKDNAGVIKQYLEFKKAVIKYQEQGAEDGINLDDAIIEDVQRILSSNREEINERNKVERTEYTCPHCGTKFDSLGRANICAKDCVFDMEDWRY